MAINMIQFEKMRMNIERDGRPFNWLISDKELDKEREKREESKEANNQKKGKKIKILNRNSKETKRK